MNNQQEEALRYFRAHATDWRDKAESSDHRKVNVIQQRNDFVLKVVQDRDQTDTALDVGCGTGDLVCELAKQGIHARGVDYAQEMIDIATQKAHGAGIEGARFDCCSIFDCHFSGSGYDLISANGFIEYISQKELDRFLDLVSAILTPQGSLVLGSRNRLFNLFSINTFTLRELETPAYRLMLKEAVRLASASDLKELDRLECAPLQKFEMEHEKTGVEVKTRYQYTPLQLVRMVHRKGFQAVEIGPIHIHGVPPTFKKRQPHVHAQISNLLQAHATTGMALVPSASSFMLHAQKGD